MSKAEQNQKIVEMIKEFLKDLENGTGSCPTTIEDVYDELKEMMTLILKEHNII